MKKTNKIFLTILFLIAVITWHGCDEFQNFPVNIPVTVEFSTSGSDNSITEIVDFCLDSNSETYQEYQDKIKSLTFIQAAYRTISVSDPNLRGNIQITVQTQGGGTTLFSVSINNVLPADYLSSAITLSLTESQIQAINAYVSSLSNKCFRATLTISNITGATAPYSVQGAVDMVFEADTEL